MKMSFKKIITFLQICIVGSYVLHISLVGEAETGVKQTNYLEQKLLKELQTEKDSEMKTWKNLTHYFAINFPFIQFYVAAKL